MDTPAPLPHRSRPADRLLRRTAPRLAGLVLLDLAGNVLAWAEAERTDGAGGADIGLGLLLFAAFALAAAGWAACDGVRSARRGESAPGWLLCWALVAVLFGAVSAVLISAQGALYGEGLDPAVLRSDVLGVSPFIALLVAVPALGAFGLGLAAASPGQRHGQTGTGPQPL